MRTVPLLLLVLLLVARHVQAATYYVATTGSDVHPGSQAQPFQTIDKGVSMLAAGDTLYIRGGTYNPGRFGQHASVLLPSGTSWSNAVTIAGFPGETVTLTGPRAGMTLADPVAYIIFDNLVIEASSHGGIFLGCTTHHIRFQNGEIRNGVDTALISGCGSFLEVLNSKIHHSLSANPQVPGGSCYGFYWGGSDALFDRNEVYSHGGYAYHIYSWGATNVSNNIISNNLIHGNGLSGCNQGSGFGNVIVSSGTNNQVYNNVVYGNFTGIQVDYRCVDCKVYHNTIYSNTTGQATGIYIGRTVSGTRVHNNIVYANGQPGITNDGDAGAVISHNWLDANGDPQFVNPTAHDFRLQTTSPAMDAGIALSAVRTDVQGHPRPQGAGYDIGAYEGQGSLPRPLPAPRNLRVFTVIP